MVAAGKPGCFGSSRQSRQFQWSRLRQSHQPRQFHGHSPALLKFSGTKHLPPGQFQGAPPVLMEPIWVQWYLDDGFQ